MDVDLNKAIRDAIRTGRVELGLDTTVKAAMAGRARLIIVSNKVPPDRLEDLKHYTALSETPIISFNGNSADLGRTCRKPFQISSLAIVDPGNSNILSAAAKGA